MSESLPKSDQSETISWKAILRMFHPDINGAKIPPELVSESDTIIKLINEARERGSEPWEGSSSDSDQVHFLREKEGVYEEAPRATLIGSPQEFVANLQRYIETGELPSLEWEEEVKSRPKLGRRERGRQKAAEAEAEGEGWEAIRNEQAEYRKICEEVKKEIEGKFPFVTVELPDPSFDSEKILFCLRQQILKNLSELSTELQREIHGTKVSFIKGFALFTTPIKRPVELQVEVPGYFRLLTQYGELNEVAENLRQIRNRHKDKVEDPLSLPTEKTFFWIDDLARILKSQFEIDVAMGKYDDSFASSKIHILHNFFHELNRLDKKYQVALKGSRIAFEGEDFHFRGLARIKITYPWPGVPDYGAADMVRRVKAVVDEK